MPFSQDRVFSRDIRRRITAQLLPRNQGSRRLNVVRHRASRKNPREISCRIECSQQLLPSFDGRACNFYRRRSRGILVRATRRKGHRLSSLSPFVQMNVFSLAIINEIRRTLLFSCSFLSSLISARDGGAFIKYPADRMLSHRSRTSDSAIFTFGFRANFYHGRRETRAERVSIFPVQIDFLSFAIVNGIRWIFLVSLTVLEIILKYCRSFFGIHFLES